MSKRVLNPSTRQTRSGVGMSTSEPVPDAQGAEDTLEGGFIQERYSFSFEYEPPEPGETFDGYCERMAEAFQEQMLATVEGLVDGSDPVLGNALEELSRRASPAWAKGASTTARADLEAA